MVRYANLVEQAMELADARVDLLRQVTRIHDVHGEGGKKRASRIGLKSRASVCVFRHATELG